MWEFCRSAVCLGEWVYNFQTLIGAALALAAAFIAAQPVWAQLKRMEVQNDGLLREVTRERIIDVDRRIAELKATLDEYLLSLRFEDEVEPEQAFYLSQEGDRVRNRLDRFSRAFLEPSYIEDLKRAVSICIAVIVDSLDAIHLPQTHPDDEENPLTPERLAQVEALAATAEAGLGADIAQLSSAYRDLLGSYRSLADDLRRRLSQLDDRLFKRAT